MCSKEFRPYGTMFDGMTAVHFYAQNNSLGMLKGYLENRGFSNLFRKDNAGQTPITYAIAYNSIDVLEFLMKNGGKNVVNDFDKDQYRNPLFLAIRSGNINVIKILLDNGADVNIQNKRGMSALHFLSVPGTLSRDTFIEILELLIYYGADMNIQDDTSKTFLDYIYDDLEREEIRTLAHQIISESVKEPHTS